ncbi:hypothetical protein F5146DRAFT_1002462 [Armillaria mellea]|nr:hypothetical protein F5146DRAFT_1002462 [Armillaria mellea]
MNQLPPLTWLDFLNLRLDHHVAVDDTPLHAEIDAYFISNLPASEGFLRQSDLDPAIIKRIIDSFYAFMSLFLEIYNVVCTAVETLNAKSIGVVESTSSAQQGNIIWKTLRVGTCTPLKFVVVKATSPAVLFHHAGELQQEQEYTSEPQLHAKAMTSTDVDYLQGNGIRMLAHRYILDSTRTCSGNQSQERRVEVQKEQEQELSFKRLENEKEIVEL